MTDFMTPALYGLLTLVGIGVLVLIVALLQQKFQFWKSRNLRDAFSREPHSEQEETRMRERQRKERRIRFLEKLGLHSPRE